jgi:hypothetical protein
MSDLPATAGSASRPPAPLFEQWLFEHSRLGTFGTSAAIFLVLLGSFEGAALASHYSLADQLTFRPQEGAWPAVILSLLAAVALGMQRYVRLKDTEDGPALARLIGCDAQVMAVDTDAARTRLRRATLIGAIIGAAISYLAVPDDAQSHHLGVFLWFGFIMALLGAMFARGTTMTRIATRNFTERIDRDLKIDLLRVDELSIIGRSGARASLIWLCVAAVISLFFVSGQAAALVIATIVISAGMAAWLFYRSLTHVHMMIRQAKRDELERLRRAITEQRTQAVHDHAAAARLQGLLAYEARIEKVHEWPFDQLTLLRVSTYVLIPATPALGQLAMKYFTDHMHL